jgi:hypothetical protein
VKFFKATKVITLNHLEWWRRAFQDAIAIVMIVEETEMGPTFQHRLTQLYIAKGDGVNTMTIVGCTGGPRMSYALRRLESVDAVVDLLPTRLDRLTFLQRSQPKAYIHTGDISPEEAALLKGVPILRFQELAA